MDLVSIIIPYYKKELFLKSTIKSILKQSYNKFEIIIIDDEISKESKSFLTKIYKLDKRILVINNVRNLGAGLSRNKGIIKSRGKYIAFCDSDDLWHKNKLKFQISNMKKSNLEITSTNYKIIDKNNNILGFRKTGKHLNFKKLLNSCDIGLSTVIIKKTLFKNKFYKFADLQTKEDYVLWLKITRDKIIITNFNKNYTSWRKTKNSLSSSIIQKLLDGFRVYNSYMKYNFLHSFLRLTILSLSYLKKY
jgi:teichuronic acid biosynthesis glycosyltransferase TuaG